MTFENTHLYRLTHLCVWRPPSTSITANLRRHINIGMALWHVQAPGVRFPVHRHHILFRNVVTSDEFSYKVCYDSLKTLPDTMLKTETMDRMTGLISEVLKQKCLNNARKINKLRTLQSFWKKTYLKFCLGYISAHFIPKCFV